jgi:hypothetical protein
MLFGEASWGRTKPGADKDREEDSETFHQPIIAQKQNLGQIEPMAKEAAKTTAKALVKAAQRGLSALANPQDAPAMQAYLKTDMPFYGVKTPPRRALMRELAGDFAPSSQRDYHAKVAALWKLPHREEKYLASNLARRWKSFIQPEAMPLYEKNDPPGSVVGFCG